MELTATERYNGNMLPALENFIKEQSKDYSLSANLALLRIYAIYPEKTSIQILSQLLVKAITRLPGTDFATLLHLIPERLQEDQEIATLVVLMQHLDSARFQSFWVAVDAFRSVNLSKVPGFVEIIRNHILRAVNSTCQKVRMSALADYLRLDSSALDTLIESKMASEGWRVVKLGSESIIELPRTNHNVLKEQASQSTAFRHLHPMSQVVSSLRHYFIILLHGALSWTSKLYNVNSEHQSSDFPLFKFPSQRLTMQV